MEDCLYGMMLESANEVCIAVAEHISGSVDAFVELMNQKAASWDVRTRILPTQTVFRTRIITRRHMIWR